MSMNMTAEKNAPAFDTREDALEAAAVHPASADPLRFHGLCKFPFW